MQEHNYPDETLMAYADGELDDATAAELDQALARDPELLRRLALFTGTRDVLAEAAAARPLDPVPDALMARVRAPLAAGAAAPPLARLISSTPRWATILGSRPALSMRCKKSSCCCSAAAAEGPDARLGRTGVHGPLSP